MAIIKMTHNDVTYMTQSTSKELNRKIGRQLFQPFSSNIIDLDIDDFNKIQSLLSRVKSSDEASDAQLNYLVGLGVNIAGKKISKQLASQLIDAVKSGNGIGSLGFNFTDGGN